MAEAPELHTKKGAERLLKKYGSIGAIRRATGYNVNTIRKWMERHGLRKPPCVAESIAAEAVQAEKARISQQRDRRLAQELKRKAALDDMIMDALREAIAPVNWPPIMRPVKLIWPSRSHEEPEAMVAVISDTQIGKKTPHYGIQEFRERLNSYKYTIKKLAELHQQNYPLCELVIFMLGDIVDGESIYPGHAFGIEQSVINQVFQVGVPAFRDFLHELSQDFPQIRVICVPGNHGRNSKFGAPETNWDRVFYRCLEMTLSHDPTISFQIAADQEFYQVAEVNGHRFLLVHGDEIPIWMNVPYYGIERSSSRWAQSIPRGPWEYLVMGHFHQSAWLKANAKKIVMNGAFPTDDPYVLKRLKLDTTEAVQWVFGVHPRRISWRYEVDLLKKYDTEGASE